MSDVSHSFRERKCIYCGAWEPFVIGTACRVLQQFKAECVAQELRALMRLNNKKAGIQ